VDGDAYMDFVCGGDSSDGGSSTTGLYYFSGNGAGTWTQTTITPNNNWAGVEIVDTDGDGLDEVWAAHTASSSSIGVSFWEWSGSAFTQTGTGITSPFTTDGVNYINILDITGDSSLDMVVATWDRGVKYFEGDGSGGWTEYSTGLPTTGASTMSNVSDLNNDNMKDIIVGEYGGSLHAYTLDSTSSPSWTDISSTFPIETGVRILAVVSGDVNSDGDMDIVVNRRTGPNGLYVLLGNDGGATGSDFQWTYVNSSFNPQPGSTWYQSHLLDIDLDGDLDFLGTKEQYGLHVYLGNGTDNPGLNFGWSEVTNKGLPTTMRFFGSNYFDFDNDGDDDVVGCTWGNGIRVYENNLTLPDVPIARAGDDQMVFIGNTVTLDGTASSDPQDCPGGDTAGTILTYDWNLTAQPPGSTLTDADLSPSDADAKPTFDPTHTGNYTFSLRVQDGDSYWSVSEDQVKIWILPANLKPVADAGPDQIVYNSSLVTLDGTGTTDDSDPIGSLVFDWNVSAGNPAAVTLSDETAVQPTFTAPETLGDYYFTLVVQDTVGLWSLEDEVMITVELVPNIKPVANAGVDFSAFSNTTINLDGSASNDFNGTIVTWDWNCTSHPSLTINNENSSSPNFTPTAAGDYTFTLTVMDDRGGWADEDDVTVTVIEKNKYPIPHAGADFTAFVDTEVSLDGSASSDPEGSINGWEWTCTSHALGLSDANTSSPTFTPDKKEVYTFTLRVMDDLFLWSLNKDSVNVTVVEPFVNKVPVADAGPDQTVEVNTTVTLDGSLSADEDGTITQWDWNCTSHTSLVFDNEDSSAPTLYADEIGTYEITLVVKDDIGAWSTGDTVEIIVVPEGGGGEEEEEEEEEENHPPTVTITYPTGDLTIGGTQEITWTAEDPDDDTLTFKIELVDTDGNVVDVVAEDLGSDVRSYELDTSEYDDGIYRIVITVSDGTDTDDSTSPPFTLQQGGGGGESGGIFSSPLFWVFLILAIVIVLVVIAVIIVMVIKKGEKEEEEPDVQEPDQLYRPGEEQSMVEQTPIQDSTTAEPVFGDSLAPSPGQQTQYQLPPAPGETAAPQKPTQGKCSQCGNENMMFNDDGSGSCPGCGRTFYWDPSKAPQEPTLEETPDLGGPEGQVDQGVEDDFTAPDSDFDDLPDPIGPGDMQP
jgi:hypothetical protein